MFTMQNVYIVHVLWYIETWKSSRHRGPKSRVEWPMGTRLSQSTITNIRFYLHGSTNTFEAKRRVILRSIWFYYSTQFDS